jgi:hypothetical protein
LWNIFYGSAHMAVTVFVLVFLFALRPAAYQTCRTVFMVMNLLAIAGYAEPAGTGRQRFRKRMPLPPYSA